MITIIFFTSLGRQHNGTSAEEDNYNADVDGEGNNIKIHLFDGLQAQDEIAYTADALKSDQNQFSPIDINR